VPEEGHGVVVILLDEEAPGHEGIEFVNMKLPIKSLTYNFKFQKKKGLTVFLEKAA
jgi:hypothetical protein